MYIYIYIIYIYIYIYIYISKSHTLFHMYMYIYIYCTVRNIGVELLLASGSDSLILRSVYIHLLFRLRFSRWFTR